MTRAIALTGALILAAGLAGCGKVGQLERPGPLFGSERSVPAADDSRQRQDAARPIDTVDPRDRDTDPAPARTLPIPGTNPSPGDVGPPGVLPDPYANPRR